MALARLPRPYTAEVTLNVFCEIERTPRLRMLYDQLVEARNQASVNIRIGREIRSTLKARSAGQMRDVGAHLQDCEATLATDRHRLRLEVAKVCQAWSEQPDE